MRAIYLTEPKSYLEADGREFVAICGGRIRYRHPVRQVRQIVAFDGCTLTRTAVRAVCRYRVPLSFIGDGGRIVAHLAPRDTAIYETAQRERNGDRQFCATFIAALLRGRWFNAVAFLRTLGDTAIAADLERRLDDLAGLTDPPTLRTWQAETLRGYRRALRALPGTPEQFGATLELACALLSRELYALLLSSGCHPEVGTLHRRCQNHLPLPCDLMEQFRPAVERWAFDGKVGFRDRVAFVRSWECFMAAEVLHPHAGPSSLRDALSWQVDEYVRAITETAEYRPFLLMP